MSDRTMVALMFMVSAGMVACVEPGSLVFLGLSVAAAGLALLFNYLDWTGGTS